MRTLLGLILFTLAALLLVAELVMLDPAAAGLGNDADPYATQPWYVHAGWFAAIGMMGWISIRLLNGGILGRLVRGRGFTPADR